MVDLRWKTFITVIQEGTLAKAGDKLGLTQPAVSQHLKAMEEHYKQPLFNHRGRRLVLNDAGHLVRKNVEKALLKEQGLEQKLKGLLMGQSRFNLGATLTVGEFILPGFLGQYHQAYPVREISIHIRNTDSILNGLKKGEIDLAVIEGPFDSTSIKSHHFMEDEMIFIGTESYLPDSIDYLDLKTLQKSRLILREEGSGTRYYWEAYKKRNKLTILDNSFTMEVGSLSAIKSLVEAGYGCSVMSRYAVEKELLLGSLTTKPFLWGPILRDLNFVYTENSPLAFVEEFIAFCQEGLKS